MADLLMKQAVAVIDDRTTVICLHVAGQIRPIDAPFETLIGEQDEPPFHVHCRTIEMPWLPGFVNDVRRQANTELMHRPLKQRRIGPNGETGSLPPKVAPTPPIPIDPVLTPVERPADLADEMRWHHWQDGLTLRQRSTVQTYIGGAYKRLNQFLRGEPMNRLWQQRMAQTATEMDEVFTHAVALSGPADVYRGVPAALSDDYPEGRTVVDEGYGSTSLVEVVAREFAKAGGWVLRIRLDRGQRVLLGNAREAELILPRGTAYRVVARDEESRTIVLEVTGG